MSKFVPVKERITIRPLDEAAVTRLASELNIPRGIAAVLVGRNFTTFGSCKSFFRPDLNSFYDPFLFKSMEKAVNRILDAIARHEKIMVYGDYDVDGVTSTALMISVLRELKADCDYYLPNRLTEGYGISKNGIEQIRQSGAKLIISVDCGITSNEEVALAREAGIDFIVTDHHEPKETVPDAVAIVNPKVSGSGYPETVLAGVGVTLKLCQGIAKISGYGDSLWRPYLDLVALGTAADIVPLVGENRIITRFGFEQLSNSSTLGIRELIDQQGLTGKKLSTSQVVFQLAPCINAVGRLGDPRRGVELLLTRDQNMASGYAKDLRAANLERRGLDNAVAEEAGAWVYCNCDPDSDVSIVVGKEEWHVGVIGIVASKMVEKFHRPAILLSIDKDGIARGSGRSIPGLHLLEALNRCSDVLDGFGGHAAAAGLTLKSENIDSFRKKFNSVVREMVRPEDLVPLVVADAEVSLAQLTPKFYRIIKEMEPFGPGNMRPVFLCRDLQHYSPPRIVGSNHLKMSVTSEGSVMDAIGFNFGDRISDVTKHDEFGLAFSLEENEWNGKINLQMKVRGVSV
ncbi:MAG: single-stranded-DNA-specific exonuclease RecJ [Chitinispirillaceae bacterium]|nr:single-stranded-DNA-specific exonuclease RecJ [Chitinispirillaceae bacterium]